ncbi:MAG: hypothetical protein ACTSRG_06110 [Candidatus Helarchaeota archaeon]
MSNIKEEGKVKTEKQLNELDEPIIESKSKTLYWVRLGLFSGFFFLFFFFTALVVNILPNNDSYQVFIDVIRDFTVLPIKEVYGLFVPPEFWHNEAVYITSVLILVFFTVGLLCANKGFSSFLFNGSNKKQFGSQLLIFMIFFIAYMRLFEFLPKYVFNILTPIVVLIAATITWLIFQTTALFRYSRRYASSAEGFLIKHDNKLTYGIVVTSTFWGLFIIIGLGYAYYYLLDIVKGFGVSIDLWRLFTIILGGTLTFSCLVAFIISVSSKENKRQRRFDNFAIMATNITLWPYILLNLAIYFFMTSSIVSSGNNMGAIRVLSITDLAISVGTLIMSMRGLGSKTDWKFGPLKREGFILLIYSAVAGQYGIRYLLFRQQLVPINSMDVFTVLVEYQLFVNIFNIMPLDTFLILILLPFATINPYYVTFLIDPRLEFLINMGNLITSFAVILLLIGAIVLYGVHREKFGKIFRVHEVGAKKGRATTDFIYDYIKQEFVRRNQPFPIYEVQEVLANSIELDLNTAIRLINKTNLKYKDMVIDGMKKRYVHFI